MSSRKCVALWFSKSCFWIPESTISTIISYFGLHLHLSPDLHPSLSDMLADTVYTLKMVKTAVIKQSSFCEKNIVCWLWDWSCDQNYFWCGEKKKKNEIQDQMITHVAFFYCCCFVIFKSLLWVFFFPLHVVFFFFFTFDWCMLHHMIQTMLHYPIKSQVHID